MRGTKEFPNTLTVLVTTRDWGHGHTTEVVELEIDGTPLSDAAEVAPLPLDDARTLARGWLGERVTALPGYDDSGSAIPIATCTCGIYGCGGLSIRVTNEPQHVVWTVCGPFGEPMGTTWRFDRRQLKAAIAGPRRG